MSWAFRGRHNPTDDLAQVVDHQTHLAADDPPVVGHALCRTPDVGSAQRRRHRSRRVEWAWRGTSGTIANPLRSLRNRRVLSVRRRETVGDVPLQPAVKDLLAHAFDGELQADGHDLTGPKRSLGVLGSSSIRSST